MTSEPPDLFFVCDGCRAKREHWETTPEGQRLCRDCSMTYHSTDPYWDDPCIEYGHDWVNAGYGDDCLVCCVCGVYDC